MNARVLLAGAMLLLVAGATRSAAEVVKYVRYQHEGRTMYGILVDDTVRELEGSIFEQPTPTGKSVKLSAVRLLAPHTPGKVLAVGLNYKSHIGDTPAPGEPPIFIKLPTNIVGPDGEIVFPEGASNVHYEGELVVVIGKRAKNVPVSKAREHVFGITAGNDVSERHWQRNDMQWFRAKASDTFGPMGPAIVTGLDYNNLKLTTRLNGEERQSTSTASMIHSIDAVVSHISKFITLEPGDVIFTGTPGTTRAMQPGDVVEVEIEGVGVLRNRVAARPSGSQQE
jgi:2-keto-4-pentenoate hydratase/2-oxohepta-3-ene-1,7-dioic acid hydratase in catechol pathway